MESKFVSRARTVFQSAAAKAERVLTEIKADLVAELSSHSRGKGELPWIGCTEDEAKVEIECRRRILEIPKHPDFLHNEQAEEVEVDMQSAMAIMEYDENLRDLRSQYVPKVMKENEFWKRYFAAVQRVKHSLLASNEMGSGSNFDSVSKEVHDRESPKKHPLEEEANRKALVVPPLALIRRLASAVEYARSFVTMRDLSVLGSADKDTSQGNDWSSLVSGLKKLSARDKDKRSKSQHHKYQALLLSLFDTDEGYYKADRPNLPEELHGAPPGSFVAQLAELTAGLRTEQKMAEFWLEVVKECRRRWEDSEPIPRIPVDASPDLNYCLLLQQLQVINCCISRRKRRAAAQETLASVQGRTVSECSEENPDKLFAKLKDGEVVPRLCADRPAEGLKMLETGEPIYSPVTQEGPVLTEDLIKETEELVLRTGSFGAGCSQLFSDMQAFKAANPGCILEDFVRWYSPPDWRVDLRDDSSLRGSLSTRMKSEGNLWQELWFSARPVPAVSQAPLFDEELAGESTLAALEEVSPADYFEQLFITILCLGSAIAEAGSSTKLESLKRCLRECKDYIRSTCHRNMDLATLEQLCEVYELMETAINSEAQAAESADTKTESKTLSAHLAEIRKFLQKKQSVKEQQQEIPAANSNNNNNNVNNNKGDGPVSSVVKFFESKASLFDRKSKQNAPVSDEPKLCSAESGDWTLV